MPGTKCAVPSCKNNVSKVKNLSFFRIPKDRCNDWSRAIGNKKLEGKSPEELNRSAYRVCSVHFPPETFTNTRRDKLIWNAVPTLFLSDETNGDADDPNVTAVVGTSAGPDNAAAGASIGVDSQARSGSSGLQGTPPEPSADPDEDEGIARDSSNPLSNWEMEVDDENLWVDIDPSNAMDNPEVYDFDSMDTFDDFHEASGQPLPASTPVNDHIYCTPRKTHDHAYCDFPDSTEKTRMPGSARPRSCKRGKRAPLPRNPRIPDSQKTPLIRVLLKNNRACRERYGDLKRKYKKNLEELRDTKRDKEQKALEVIRPKVEERLFKILQCQMRNSGRDPHGFRYTPEEHSIFIGLNQSGPKGYRNLPFIRPSRKTIRRNLKRLNLKPGVNPILKQALKARADAMQEQEKHVFIAFDETAGKVRFTYNSVNDCFDGVVDLGDGDRRNLPAEEIMIAMVRSVYGQWKQPLAFWYTHKKLTAADFEKMFCTCIEAVISTGLKVRCICVDSLGKNIAALNALGSSNTRPFFELQGKKIYTVPDVPHCLKSLRNALLMYILSNPDGLVKMEYINTFIREDIKMHPRLAKKVTETHLSPNSFQKMSVPLAAQLLHIRVAAGLSTYAALGGLPGQAMVTAKFLEKIYHFFQSWNGVVVEANPEPGNFRFALTDESGHIPMWHQMIHEMENWHFIGSQRLAFHHSWARATRAVLSLWEDLKAEGHTYLPVGHINSDCQENLNACLRALGGHRHTISVQDFPSIFASALVRFLTVSVKGKNCRDDNAHNIFHLNVLLEIARNAPEEAAPAVAESFFEAPVLMDDTEDEGEDEPVEQEEEEDQPAEPSFVMLSSQQFQEQVREKLRSVCSAHVSAPLIDRHCKALNCEQCRDMLQSSPIFPLHAVHMLNEQNPQMMLNAKVPSPAVAQAFQAISKMAAVYFPEQLSRTKILASFVEMMGSCPDVRALRLCPLHEDQKMSLLWDMSRQAMEDVLLALNQSYKAKKREIKNRKVQRVTHQ